MTYDTRCAKYLALGDRERLRKAFRAGRINLGRATHEMNMINRMADRCDCQKCETERVLSKLEGDTDDGTIFG